ncbi:MAG TPA: nitrilase-related carbon-nitrogen hydrolase [Acidimicrobiia bacterium]|nr:nitrilase-related carbon-nitrogen hydrolase [Acidimicrobiia bacterium]
MIVAVGQLYVGEGDVDTNAWRCQRALADAAVAGAELLVLPECALTGYRFDDRDAAEVAAIRACDPRIRELDDNCGHVVATTSVDLGQARTKTTVFEPGEFEIDVFAHRRPDLYGSLSPDQEL